MQNKDWEMNMKALSSKLQRGKTGRISHSQHAAHDCHSQLLILPLLLERRPFSRFTISGAGD